MKDFSKMITEPNARQDADTNEVIGVLLAASCLAFTCAPLIGALGNGLSSFFGSLFGGKKDDEKDKDDKDKDKDKDDKGKDDKGKETPTPNKDNKEDGDTASKEAGKGDNSAQDRESFNYLLMLSKKANEKEKDENAKKKNDAMLKLITASAFDKDGKEVSIDQIAENMKGSMSPEQFEAFKKDMTEAYEKNKDNQDFKDALAKAKANIKPEEYDQMLEAAKTEAKSTLEQLEKEKKEIEEHEKKLQELENKINNTDDDAEKKKLLAQQQQLQQNPPQTLAGGATGVTTTTPAGGGGEVDTTAEEQALAEKTQAADKAKADYDQAKQELDQMNSDLEGKDKDSQEYKDLKAQIAEKETAVNNLKTASDKAEQDKKDAQTALDKKKNGGGEPKPKEKTKEEIDAELEAIDKEYKQKDKALDDEYKEKIDNETDETKKQQLQDELAKKKKSLKAEMNKKKDDVDDNDTHDTQNDETKKGKYTVAEEEIEDPKTGKKIKVKTYTGPRGGKFYYPEGAPHTPEHKVYLESLTLSQYMFEIFS